jgi:hypothetical protein
MGCGLVGDKTGNLGIWVAGDGRVRWRRAGGGVLVVGEVMGGGGLRGFWILGRRGTEGRFRAVRLLGKKWENEKKM